MAVEDSVAQDQIRAFIERIERMEAEKAAIASDIKEIYAEAKGNGFDTKILRRVVTIRKRDANERMEQEALLELYMGALGMISVDYTEQERGERDRLNSLASQVEAGLRKPAADPLAALRADPALAVVDVSNLKSKHQPSQPAGSDLTASPTSSGQVAPHQPETATSSTEQRPAEAAHVASVADHENGEAGGRTRALPEGENLPVDTETDKSVEASASAAPASKYAAPGEVTWENHPPEGVERSSFSIAFGNMGQDPVLIQHDLEKGTAQPIVKMGKVIIDGWARYMVARNMRELDGQALSYPVVQYDGTDPLIDVIRWNVDGRTLDDHQKKLIAATLTRQNPARKDDIYRAFEIFLEPV